MVRNDFVTRELARRQATGLTRTLRCIDGPQDTWVRVDGQRALLLCSNNYLGLANHPAVRDAVQQAVTDYGVGAGASRLISGSMRLHHDLEARLAAFKGTEAALLFSSGYHANIGTITALVGASSAMSSITPASSTAAGCHAPG
jgi:7-keto-8-aminopelargonate synthetase-like enzyme